MGCEQKKISVKTKRRTIVCDFGVIHVESESICESQRNFLAKYEDIVNIPNLKHGSFELLYRVAFGK